MFYPLLFFFHFQVCLLSDLFVITQWFADLLNKNEEAYNKIEDITQVKESIQLQNQTLEKRLLATEVELLRKIVSLYEKQPVQQPIIYNYPNSNGVSTTGTTNTFATSSSTINGY